jgi:hypothetical protein
VDRLPERQDGRRRAEGGLRLQGRLKSPAPGAPLVSYLTVVRNAASTLPRTLASVKAQRGAAVEHLVVDGLSDDGTLSVIEAHAGQIDYYVSEPDAGLYDALNKAVSLARGSLVCVLNADDWLTGDAAATASRALLRLEPDVVNPAPCLLLTAAWALDGRQRRLWLPGALDASSWLRCPDICHNGVYATPAAYRATGPYDGSLRIVADSLWLLTALQAGVAIEAVPHPTVNYSMGGLSGDTRRHVAECAQLVERHFPALADDEVWGLLHAFYPHEPHLAPFAERCPADLGGFLTDLVTRHGGHAALMSSLEALQWQRQQGHAARVRPARIGRAAKFRRSMLKRWFEWRAASVG